VHSEGAIRRRGNASDGAALAYISHLRVHKQHGSYGEAGAQDSIRAADCPHAAHAAQDGSRSGTQVLNRAVICRLLLLPAHKAAHQDVIGAQRQSVLACSQGTSGCDGCWSGYREARAPRTTMTELEVALWDTSWAPAVSSRTSSSLAVTGVSGRAVMHRLSGPGVRLMQGVTSPISRGPGEGGNLDADRSY